MDKVHEFTLDTVDFGGLKILRPISTEENPWGNLSILRDTPWGDQIPVVSGEVYSHATHGYALPLMKVIGPPPEALLRMIPQKFRGCASSKDCLMIDYEVCQPCVKMPDCYIPQGVSESIALAASLVMLAWKEGRYVVIVEGMEFGD